MGPTGCPETSVRNCHYSLRNNPEGRGSHLRNGDSLKSSIVFEADTTNHVTTMMMMIMYHTEHTNKVCG
jgi:hypothetical protein